MKLEYRNERTAQIFERGAWEKVERLRPLAKAAAPPPADSFIFDGSKLRGSPRTVGGKVPQPAG